MLAQLRQVNLVAQGGAEGCYSAGSIILAAVEAAINDGLNAMAQWLEEGGNREGKDHNSGRVILMKGSLKEGLHPKLKALRTGEPGKPSS